MEQESPVHCGNCGDYIPLYKLPFIPSGSCSDVYEQEHYRLMEWKKAYRDVDRLFMNCLSDRFTYRQMNKLDSQLSKDGRDICKAYEDVVGIPFYYYVFYYRKTSALCPSCGGDWKINSEKTFIDYKCDKCRLVADEMPIKK